MLETAIERRHWLLWPGEIRLWGQALLHQQCWCWGQDIRCEEGNLLLEYGFAQRRPPENHKGSSTYSLEHEGGAFAVWGFGVFCGQCGYGLHLGRHRWAPRLAPCQRVPHPVWQPKQLSDFRAARTKGQCDAMLDLLQSALLQIASYERWVLLRRGVDYRRHVLRYWSHTVAGPQEMANDWERLATQVRRRAVLKSLLETAEPG